MLDMKRIQTELATPAPAPLYERLRATLHDQIADGTLTAGESLPSERDIQQILGVSRSTVRQALRLLTEEGLLQSVPGARTFVLEPANPAANKPTYHSNVIGVLADASSFYLYYAQLASAFNHRLRKAGYHVDLALHNNDPDHFAELIESFMKGGAAAIAINPPTWFDIRPAISQLQAADIRVIFIGRRVDLLDVDYIGTDNRLLGYQATRHLLDLGHTQIIHIGTPNYSTAQDRAEGYVQAMEEAGLPPRIHPRPVESYMESAPLPPHLAAFMEHRTDPSRVWMDIVKQDITAAFCFNDETAIWVQKGLCNFNLEVPKDISLVGADNLPFVFDVPLTTFALPGEQVGDRAAGIVLRRLHNENFPPQQIEIPADFIQRVSTALPKKKANWR